MKQMNQIFRKIGCMAAAAAVLAVQMPAVSADESLFPGSSPQQTSGTTLDGKWTYFDDGEGNISVAANDKTMVNAEVPASINGSTVSIIDVECFMDMTSLETVTLPDTITTIKDFAFYNCTALKEVNLPNGLESISWEAFYGCTSLEEVTIPASVTTIEEFVFEGCDALKAIHVSDGNPNYKDADGVLFDKAGTLLIRYPSAKTDIFYDIPDGCTSIEDWAFIGNTYMEEIDLGGVTYIGEDAFYHCTALKAVQVPDGITDLPGATFGNCTSLAFVTLPSTLTTLGDSCFYSCSSLVDIVIPDSVTLIGNYAFFNCPSLERIALKETVISIGDYSLGYYYSDTEELKRVPGFVIDTANNTQAFAYALENDIKSTGGITQSSVFIYIIIGVIALVILCTIVVVIVQRRIQKRYELR